MIHPVAPIGLINVIQFVRSVHAPHHSVFRPAFNKYTFRRHRILYREIKANPHWINKDETKIKYSNSIVADDLCSSPPSPRQWNATSKGNHSPGCHPQQNRWACRQMTTFPTINTKIKCLLRKEIYACKSSLRCICTAVNCMSCYLCPFSSNNLFQAPLCRYTL